VENHVENVELQIVYCLKHIFEKVKNIRLKQTCVCAKGQSFFQKVWHFAQF